MNCFKKLYLVRDIFNDIKQQNYIKLFIRINHSFKTAHFGKGFGDHSAVPDQTLAQRCSTLFASVRNEDYEVRRLELFPE